MASQQYITNFISFVLFVICVVSFVQSSPVPTNEADTPNAREGRYFGGSMSNSAAFASSGASGLGYGYPGFGGYGGSSAMASAHAGSMGGFYGK